jgi:peptidylprolyl isomerase domain and WD repeat-containing protein 1
MKPRDSKRRKTGPDDDQDATETKHQEERTGDRVVLLQKLPSASQYERSYSHPDVVTRLVLTALDFLVTGDCSGNIRFWKKSSDKGIEFVRRFKAHSGTCPFALHC